MKDFTMKKLFLSSLFLAFVSLQAAETQVPQVTRESHIGSCNAFYWASRFAHTVVKYSPMLALAGFGYKHNISKLSLTPMLLMAYSALNLRRSPKWHPENRQGIKYKGQELFYVSQYLLKTTTTKRQQQKTELHSSITVHTNDYSKAGQEYRKGQADLTETIEGFYNERGAFPDIKAKETKVELERISRWITKSQALMSLSASHSVGLDLRRIIKGPNYYQQEEATPATQKSGFFKSFFTIIPVPENFEG